MNQWGGAILWSVTSYNIVFRRNPPPHTKPRPPYTKNLRRRGNALTRDLPCRVISELSEELLGVGQIDGAGAPLGAGRRRPLCIRGGRRSANQSTTFAAAAVASASHPAAEVVAVAAGNCPPLSSFGASDALHCGGSYR